MTFKNMLLKNNEVSKPSAGVQYVVHRCLILTFLTHCGRKRKAKCKTKKVFTHALDFGCIEQ